MVKKRPPASPASTPPPAPPPGLHPRNPHRNRYDFPRLLAAHPELAAFLRPHPVEGDTIDFADPAAVLALNRALLHAHYGITHWELPPGALCPPIPGRADYLHHVADLLPPAATARPENVAVLDIGTGSNCIYPLLGASAFGWRFVATDCNADSLRWAEKLIAANPAVAGRIECRRQPDPLAVFTGVARAGEHFALSVCNPPFHDSPATAEAGTARKLRNLGTVAGRRDASGRPVLNFGGRDHELWCPGGELGFIRRMIAESARHPALCGWFTTLVSKSAHLPFLHEALARAGTAETRVLAMRHGQKFSRILAWRFATAA